MITPLTDVRITPLTPALPDLVGTTPVQESPTETFTTFLTDAMQKANDSHLKADAAVKRLLTGEGGDIHQVVLAMEQARMTMTMITEVRNKMLDAYQELSRMPL